MDMTTKLRMATATAAGLDGVLEAAGIQADALEKADILRLATQASLPMDFQVSISLAKL